VKTTEIVYSVDLNIECMHVTVVLCGFVVFMSRLKTTISISKTLNTLFSPFDSRGLFSRSYFKLRFIPKKGKECHCEIAHLYAVFD